VSRTRRSTARPSSAAAGRCARSSRRMAPTPARRVASRRMSRIPCATSDRADERRSGRPTAHRCSVSGCVLPVDDIKIWARPTLGLARSCYLQVSKALTLPFARAFCLLPFGFAYCRARRDRFRGRYFSSSHSRAVDAWQYSVVVSARALGLGGRGGGGGGGRRSLTRCSLRSHTRSSQYAQRHAHENDVACDQNWSSLETPLHAPVDHTQHRSIL